MLVQPYHHLSKVDRARISPYNEIGQLVFQAKDRNIFTYESRRRSDAISGGYTS